MSDENEHNLPPEDRIPEILQPSPAEQFPGEEGAAPSEQKIESPGGGRKFKLTWQFAGGFLGWFLVNWAIWLVQLGGRNFSLDRDTEYGICMFPVNVLVLIILYWMPMTRQIGQGILAAWGFNLIISLILNMVNNAICLVPFFS